MVRLPEINRKDDFSSFRFFEKNAPNHDSAVIAYNFTKYLHHLHILEVLDNSIDGRMIAIQLIHFYKKFSVDYHDMVTDLATTLCYLKQSLSDGSLNKLNHNRFLASIFFFAYLAHTWNNDRTIMLRDWHIELCFQFFSTQRETNQFAIELLWKFCGGYLRLDTSILQSYIQFLTRIPSSSTSYAQAHNLYSSNVGGGFHNPTTPPVLNFPKIPNSTIKFTTDPIFHPEVNSVQMVSSSNYINSINNINTLFPPPSCSTESTKESSSASRLESGNSVIASSCSVISPSLVSTNQINVNSISNFQAENVSRGAWHQRTSTNNNNHLTCQVENKDNFLNLEYTPSSTSYNFINNNIISSSKNLNIPMSSSPCNNTKTHNFAHSRSHFNFNINNHFTSTNSNNRLTPNISSAPTYSNINTPTNSSTSSSSFNFHLHPSNPVTNVSSSPANHQQKHLNNGKADNSKGGGISNLPKPHASSKGVSVSRHRC